MAKIKTSVDYIDKKTVGSCDEHMEGIAALQALFAKVFTDKLGPSVFQVSGLETEGSERQRYYLWKGKVSLVQLSK